MLRITADVNGRAIGYVYVHNVGEHRPGVFRYHAASWNPDAPLLSVFGIEDIIHQRDEGWEKLAQIALRYI